MQVRGWTWVSVVGALALMSGAGCAAPDAPSGESSGPGVDAQAGAGGVAAAAGDGAPGGGGAGGAGGASTTVEPSAGAGAAGGGGSQAGQGGSSGAGGASAVAGVPGLPIAPECQGIDFAGIRYSPGGTALPNVCEPFHATLNNPYAVRCVDAWPWYQTGYLGDEYCILPPPPDQGIQYGHHPHGDGDAWLEQVAAGDMSGYEDLAGSDWELAAGGESNLNYIGGTDNPEPHEYYRAYVRMRLGSHHMINSIGGATRGTWGPGSAGGLAAGDGALPTVQRPDENRPSSLEKPAEDAGLYRIYPANPNITFNLHNFNATDGPILRESWTNLWWEADATIPIQFMSAIPPSQSVYLPSVAQGASGDLHYSYSVAEPLRVLELWGHRHAWTPSFTAWVERPGSEPEIVYQSFDWFDAPTFRYDSQTQNPAPAPEQRSDGAHSGSLTLNPGDTLHFNCHITFTEARAAATGGPTPTDVGSLRFANEGYTAEMCILFGWTANALPDYPVDDPSPLPSFATLE